VLPLLDTIDDVADLNLHQGISNSLSVKFATALKIITDDNPKNDVAGINTLNAFINEVEAQRGKKILEADADILIAAAQQIMDLVSTE